MNLWNSSGISEEFQRFHLFQLFSSNFPWLQWNSTGIPPEWWKDFLVGSYSSWNKLVRHVALLVKIKQNWVNIKRKPNSKVGFSRLLPDEIQNAKMILCRVAQLESYLEKYNQLKYNKAIPKNSSLVPFKPFMHKSLIRVVGWTHKACRFTNKH